MTAGNHACYAGHKEATGGAASLFQQPFAGKHQRCEDERDARKRQVEAVADGTICPVCHRTLVS